MALKLYNTRTRSIEVFVPKESHHVTYYSCGPTVYDYAHIGHARTFLFSDILHRVLELNGYTVKRVMNITDVGHLTSDSDEGEDKMEKGAKREKKSVWDIASYYTEDFFSMLSLMDIKKPSVICRATDYIPQMISLIKQLERTGHTYDIADGIYFDTSTFPAYGVLTGHTFQKLQDILLGGARVDMIPGKRHVTDFALWKRSSPEERRQMEWDSPWGKGFPGWHIECSAMSMDILGETIDIHTGGVDHIPIHHTNEIAQSEAATGKQFVRYWLHGEHLLIDGKKMSKSLGNFFRLKDIEEKGYSPLALRYLFLTASYRKQMNFTWISLASAQQAWEGLRSHIAQIREANPDSHQHPVPGSLQKQFQEAMNDDLNTASAVALVWEIVKSDKHAGEKMSFVLYADDVLGLHLAEGKIDEVGDIPVEMQVLLEKREKLRQQKKWEEADAVRTTLEKKGYTIMDTPSGVRLKKK